MALLASEPQVRTDVLLPRRGRGRPGSGWLLRTTLAAANSGLLLATNHTLFRSLTHLETSGANQRRVGAPNGHKFPTNAAADTPDGGRPRGPNRLGKLRQGRPGCLCMSFVCEDYPDNQIFKEYFTNIQWAIGSLVYKFSEEGVTRRLDDSYWPKGAAIMVYQDESTKDWLAARVLPSRRGGSPGSS